MIVINCDVAEGVGKEEALFPYIHWANIACAAHAGNEAVMYDTMLLAKQHRVQIGLHPSYPDRENFGRVVMNINQEDLQKSLTAQIQTGIQIAEKAGVPVQHIKPHGALYNQLAYDEGLAHLFFSVLKTFNQPWTIVGLSESKFLSIASALGYNTAHEVFADRRYTHKKELAPRTHALAMITNKDDMLLQAKKIINNEPVSTIDGTTISIQADTICLHGDGINAETLAIALHNLITNEK